MSFTNKISTASQTIQITTFIALQWLLYIIFATPLVLTFMLLAALFKTLFWIDAQVRHIFTNWRSSLVFVGKCVFAYFWVKQILVIVVAGFVQIGWLTY